MEIHFFSGHAQLPSGYDLYETTKFVSVIMSIDIETGKILEAHVPIYHKMHDDFFCELVTGKSMETDLEYILKEIEYRFHTPSKRALITAIQTLHNRYIIVREKYLKSKSEKQKG